MHACATDEGQNDCSYPIPQRRVGSDIVHDEPAIRVVRMVVIKGLIRPNGKVS